MHTHTHMCIWCVFLFIEMDNYTNLVGFYENRAIHVKHLAPSCPMVNAQSRLIVYFLK